MVDKSINVELLMRRDFLIEPIQFNSNRFDCDGASDSRAGIYS